MALTDFFANGIDVLRLLLDDDYFSALTIMPLRPDLWGRNCKTRICACLKPKKIQIDVEIFVNCQYGYDIQCQVVGERGTANPTEPSSVLLRSEASDQYPNRLEASYH